jgi:anion-transporting  ArsA/GET3 family ATPase
MTNSIPLARLTNSRLVIVAGKGGVGKTTVTAVLARAAADAGRRVLVVELDGKPTLREWLPDLDVRHISAATSLEEYLLDHGFRRMAKRLTKSGVIEVIGTAAPGIDDLVVLGKIKQLERSNEWDLVIVDGPAAGHAVTFLTTPAGLRDAVRGGPVAEQADDVLAMLADPSRCSIVLVTGPETTPVNELLETADAVRSRVGTELAPVVVNRFDEGPEPPDPAQIDFGRLRAEIDDARSAAEFRRRRLALQQVEVARVEAEFGDGFATVPWVPVADLDAAMVTALAAPDHSGPPVPNVGRAHVTNAGEGPMADIVDESRVIVCCGSGGVGKTTTAAAIGLQAARQGRRVVVVTIDPARRLADALGLPDGLTGEPQRLGVGDGEIWAMMLDAAAMFERVVREHATDADQADRIVGNRFYRNMVSALSGTQEYMASEALHRLHADERFDLVVVDTPPSRNAIDFLEAPGVLTRFLDHKAFKLMMMPTRTGLKIFNAATQPMLKMIGRVVGSDVLSDAVSFFQAFAGMEAGFRQRADEVAALLCADGTEFVLVTAPRRDALIEAAWFTEQLGERGYDAAATVVNRVHPRFGDGSAADAGARADAARARGRDEIAAMWANLAELRSVAERERSEVDAQLTPSAAERALVVEVPLLATDVHDLATLDHLIGHLFPSPSRGAPT